MMNTPVYFISHGGPNIMYEPEHPAYKELQKIGREITSKVRPKGVVVFSAHWQPSNDALEVNTAENVDVVYDFYGFPGHYYKEKYPNRGSKELALKILDMLHQSGIKAGGVTRGLDHGVWASFKCAFNPDENPLDAPIVQVSLPDTEDPRDFVKLGVAVSRLRSENIVIICTGMAVHNLRDLRFAMQSPEPLPYTKTFDEALKVAVEVEPASREQSMAGLMQRPDLRKAHPTLEHLLPIYVGAGAAGADQGKRLWTMQEGSMSWAQYRFGEASG